MVPRGGAPPPANPNIACCLSATRYVRPARAIPPGKAAAADDPGSTSRRQPLKRSLRSQRRIARSRGGEAAAANAKRPQSADSWATLNSVDQTPRRAAGWTRTWASNTEPPAVGPTAREAREARQARPRSAPPRSAAGRSATASREYQQWGDQLHERAQARRPAVEPAARRPCTARAPAAAKPSGGTGAERLGVTPRLFHRSRGTGAFALLEARKQAVHDASRRRKREELALQAAAAAAAQRCGALEQAAARAREPATVADASVWGPERAAVQLDWRAWSSAKRAADAQSADSPPPSPRLGGERLEARPEERWESLTVASQLKQRPRIIELKPAHSEPSQQPMRLGAPRTLPLKQVDRVARFQTFNVKIERSSRGSISARASVGGTGGSTEGGDGDGGCDSGVIESSNAQRQQQQQQ